jgi:uncharacterized protein
MRLQKSDIATIKRVAREVWGEKVVVYLFGSRTDDSEKGGDIDLLIKLPHEPDQENILLKKSEFLAKLEILLGEQKIDVVIHTRNNFHLPIIKTALAKGIEL